MSEPDHNPTPQLFRIVGPDLTGLPHTVRERQFWGYPSSIDEGPAGLQMRLLLANGAERVVDRFLDLFDDEEEKELFLDQYVRGRSFPSPIT